ncbi:MAG TPA: hypothetical protein PKY10_06100, partial [Lentisphaeria bacterium]|nr:hypothetical protein [Lentisphaeria bacterium]
LRYVLLTLAVIASTWFSALIYQSFELEAESRFRLRYISSVEAMQNLHGRLRIDSENETAQGYETILIDYEPGKKPRLTMDYKTVHSHRQPVPEQIISPDGKYVAMSGKDDEGNDGYLQIRRLDGVKNLLAANIRFRDRRNIFWRPNSRTLCLQDDYNTWHVLTIQEDDSVAVQVTDYSYMTQLPPEQDLFFAHYSDLWRQKSDSAPEKLHESLAYHMHVKALTMTPDRRYLLVLYKYDAALLLAPSRVCNVLATTDLATQKTHLRKISHYLHAPQLTWEGPAHNP